MDKPDLVENEEFTGVCEQCGFFSHKSEHFIFKKETNTFLCKTCDKLNTTGKDTRKDTMKAGRMRVIVLIIALVIIIISYGISNAMAPDPADRPLPTARVNGIVQLTIIEDEQWKVSLHEFPTHRFWHPQNLGFRAGENVYLVISPTSENFHRIENWEYAWEADNVDRFE